MLALRIYLLIQIQQIKIVTLKVFILYRMQNYNNYRKDTILYTRVCTSILLMRLQTRTHPEISDYNS
jgi:hypothetical protein